MTWSGRNEISLLAGRPEPSTHRLLEWLLRVFSLKCFTKVKTDTWAEQSFGINAKSDQHQRTALTYAARDGTLEAVKTLLKWGKYDPTQADSSYHTPLHYAVERGPENNEMILELLNAEWPAANGIRDGNGHNIWHTIMSVGLFPIEDACRRLKDYGISVHDIDQGQTALHYAAMYDNIDAVHFALELDIFVDHASQIPIEIGIGGKDTNGWTPLRAAILYGKTVVAQELVRTGAKVNNNWGDSWGTPTAWAARIGNLAMVEFLVEEKDAYVGCLPGVGPEGRRRLLWLRRPREGI